MTLKSQLSLMLSHRPVAPVTYCGWQEGLAHIAGRHLYNLTAAIPGYAIGSTISEMSLIARGYVIPADLPQTRQSVAVSV